MKIPKGLADKALTAAAEQVLSAAPGLRKTIIQFIVLYDAAEVVEDLKQESREDVVARYLRELADRQIRESGLLPPEFVKILRDKRPPLADR